MGCVKTKTKFMKIARGFIMLSISMLFASFTWPSKLEKKVNQTISKSFDIVSYEIIPITIDPESEEATKKEINNCLFKVLSKKELIGYIYVGEAPSMKNIFDYAIVFSKDMQIINTKVLIYREKHGRQIGMKRWLKQFFGMTAKDRPELGIQVDGISGATISATSMTDAVSDVLSSIEYLINHNKL